MIRSRPRRYKAHSTGLLAKNFIERLERGVLADRTKDTSRGQSLKLVHAPKSLVLYRRIPQ